MNTQSESRNFVPYAVDVAAMRNVNNIFRVVDRTVDSFAMSYEALQSNKYT